MGAWNDTVIGLHWRLGVSGSAAPMVGRIWWFGSGHFISVHLQSSMLLTSTRRSFVILDVIALVYLEAADLVLVVADVGHSMGPFNLSKYYLLDK